MRALRRACALLAALCAIDGAAAAQETALLAALQPLSGDQLAEATDVAADGRRVLGISVREASDTTTVVVWDDLGAPAPIVAGEPGEYVGALRISADGSTIAGTFQLGVGMSYSSRAFRWNASEGVVALAGSENGPGSNPWGLSADGTRIFGGVVPVAGSGSRASRWDDGVLSVPTPSGFPDGVPGWLLGEADGDRLVGATAGAFLPTLDGDAYVIDGADLTALPRPQGFGSGACQATALSDDGTKAVGFCRDVFTLRHPLVRWDVDGASAEVLLDASTALPTDVSADGGVIVGSYAFSDGYEAFVWEEGTKPAFRRVSSRLARACVDPTGFDLRFANGVSADGRTIVGTSFVARLPAPEPVTGLSACAAIGALAASRSRYRAARASLASARTS